LSAKGVVRSSGSRLLGIVPSQPGLNVRHGGIFGNKRSVGVRGEHGSLTNLPSVQQAVFRWLRGQNPRLPITPRGALAEYLSDAADREASLAPHLDGSFRRGAASDDPGYLDFEPPDPRLMDELQARIGQGLVPAFERLHLL
jgi:hypothetical protein